MFSSTKHDNDIKDELGKLLHLVTPMSEGKPLCGETSPDAAIGSYTEHLDESGEWTREVFGRYGVTGRACAQCLALYPSLLWGRPHKLEDSLILQAVLQINPYPQHIRQEFVVQGFCVSDDYVIRPNPAVIGQHGMHGKVSLSINCHIDPKKPGKG